MSRPRKSIKCRLCNSKAVPLFEKLILGRHRVQYFRCESCGSQQTAKPTWLNEAYSIPGLHIDVGAPTRTLKNWFAAATLLDELDIPLSAKGIDFGAGPGLFTRLMRSVGRNFYANDKFMTPMFSNYFVVDNIPKENPDVITAFEVFEHLPDPHKTLDNLFGANAPLILFTTWFVDDQPEDWIYYLPECGQHVFFYSQKGLSECAQKYGYSMLVSQYFFVLYKPELLSTKQIQTVENFSINSITLVGKRIQDLVDSVIMGNSHIDTDFALAGTLFEKDLVASRRIRSKKFGPSKQQQISV
jgi:hypothetical protein